MHMQTASLVALQKSNRVGAPPFPLRKPSQNGPRRQGFAPPRRNGAPLTAPGRSAKTFLIRGKGGLGNLWPWHLNISLSFSHTTRALLRLQAPAQRQGGLDAETL